MELFPIIWILSIVWVWYDTDQLNKAGGRVSTGGWILFVALLWIIGLPVWCLTRGTHWAKVREKQEREKKRDREVRFNCPECGESIASTAKHCRFCNAVIADNDRPRKRELRKK